MSTHRYNTRFQASLKNTPIKLDFPSISPIQEKCKKTNEKEECDMIKSRLDACYQSPSAMMSFTIFEKACNLFDDLIMMNLWKTNQRFNTTVRNKMDEFRSQVHLIYTHDGRAVGVIIHKVTVIYDEMYLYPVKQLFSVMDRLEKAMKEYEQKQ